MIIIHKYKTHFSQHYNSVDAVCRSPARSDINHTSTCGMNIKHILHIIVLLVHHVHVVFAKLVRVCFTYVEPSHPARSAQSCEAATDSGENPVAWTCAPVMCRNGGPSGDNHTDENFTGVRHSCLATTIYTRNCERNEWDEYDMVLGDAKQNSSNSLWIAYL